jgi:hypothetical protein
MDGRLTGLVVWYMNCLLKNVTKGRMEGRMEMMGRQEKKT